MAIDTFATLDVVDLARTTGAQAATPRPPMFPGTGMSYDDYIRVYGNRGTSPRPRAPLAVGREY